MPTLLGGPTTTPTRPLAGPRKRLMPPYREKAETKPGQAALVKRAHAALAQPSAVQYYVRRDFVRIEPTYPGEQVVEDFVSAGPFATAAEAHRYAHAHWRTADVEVRGHAPLPGMVPCLVCALAVWPDEMAQHMETMHEEALPC